MSALDIEDKYPDEDFWLGMGFIDASRRGVWLHGFNKYLHWNTFGTGTSWGNVRIYAEYEKFKKTLKIFQGASSFYYDELDFDPVELHNPTQQEIEMALTDDFLSSRLTYKYK